MGSLLGGALSTVGKELEDTKLIVDISRLKDLSGVLADAQARIVDAMSDKTTGSRYAGDYVDNDWAEWDVKTEAWSRIFW